MCSKRQADPNLNLFGTDRVDENKGANGKEAGNDGTESDITGRQE